MKYNLLCLIEIFIKIWSFLSSTEIFLQNGKYILYFATLNLQYQTIIDIERNKL